MQTYKGSCHCGAVVFEIDTDFTKFTKCDCSLCTKKNAVMTKVHESRFRLLRGENSLGLYQWNTRVARHNFCTQCGIYTFHRKHAAPDHYGINVYCLDNADLSGVPTNEVDGLTMSVAPAG
ncbi:MAG: GFA family protein [Rhodospirillaceae bacterium]|nr:GFA family protein [Rhodospirillaceae bacterium]